MKNYAGILLFFAFLVVSGCGPKDAKEADLLKVGLILDQRISVLEEKSAAQEAQIRNLEEEITKLKRVFPN